MESTSSRRNSLTDEDFAVLDMSEAVAEEAPTLGEAEPFTEQRQLDRGALLTAAVAQREMPVSEDAEELAGKGLNGHEAPDDAQGEAFEALEDVHADAHVNPLEAHVTADVVVFRSPARDGLSAASKAKGTLSSMTTLFSSSLVVRRHNDVEAIPRHITILLPEDRVCLAKESMQAFVKFTGKKVLLIPEAHGCKLAVHTRQKVSKMQLIAFSEGRTGSRILGGIDGFETEADVEAPIYLKELAKYQGQEEIAGVIQTPEAFLKQCDAVGVPRAKSEAMLRSLEAARTPEQRAEVVTKWQMHDRDFNFAQQTASKVQEVAQSRVVHMGVGFYGASHIVEGCDDLVEDPRTSDQRVPDLLVRRHNAYNMGSHLLMNRESGCSRDVRIFVYPKLLESDDVNDEVLDLIRLARSRQDRT